MSAFSSSTSAFGLRPAGTTTTPAANPFAPAASQPASSPFGTQPSQATPNPFAPQQQSSTQPAANPFAPQQPSTQPAANPFAPSQPQASTPSFTLGGSTQPATAPGQSSTTGTGGFSWGQASQSATAPAASTAPNAFSSFSTTTPNTSSTATAPLGTSFLSTQPAQQQQSTWGSATAPTPSIFGASTTTPAAAAAPTAPLFTKSTKFNDLPEDLQKLFQEIENHTQGRIQISAELKTRSLGEEPTKAAELIRAVQKEVVNATNTLHSDDLLTKDLREKVDQSVQDLIIAIRIIDGFRNPQQHGLALKNHANFPLEYFTRVAEQLRERVQRYKTTVEQIERKLASTVNNTQYTPHAIAATLQAQNASFIALAARTAELDAEFSQLKAEFTAAWRARTGSARDPFDDGRLLRDGSALASLRMN